MKKSLLFLLFAAASFAACAQRNKSWLLTQNAARTQIMAGDYFSATATLEKYITQNTADTSELFDWLCNLYFLKKDWQKLSLLYSNHTFHAGEDSTLMVMADYYRDFPPEQISSPPSPSVLHFKTSPAGSPIVEIIMNGKKYHFWVDTGAGMTTLSSAIAGLAGVKIKKSPSAKATAATGNNIGISYGVIDSLRIGNLHVSSHPCIILSKKQLEFRLLGIRLFKVDGIIGWNLLQELTVTIDNRKQEISLAPSAHLPASEPNFFWMEEPLIPCRDTAGNPLLFTIDTGANTSSVFSPFVSKADTTKAVKKKLRLGSAGGFKTVTSYIFPRVALDAGGQRVVMLKLASHPTIHEGAFGPDGVFGNSELKNYIVHFDLGNCNFTLTK